MRLFDGLTEAGTAAFAPDEWVNQGLVGSGEWRVVVKLADVAYVEVGRVFVHSELPRTAFGRMEVVVLPLDPGAAAKLLEEKEAGQRDLIVLPDTVSEGTERSWTPEGNRTPILVTSGKILDEAGEGGVLNALVQIAQLLNEQGRVFRLDLDAWSRRVIFQERYLSVQY